MSSFDLVVCGKILGTATGWDEQDTLVMSFYDFTSIVDELPNSSCITIDYTTGIIESHDEEGTVFSKVSFLDIK